MKVELSRKDINDIQDYLQTIIMIYNDFKIRGRNILPKNITDDLERRQKRAKELIDRLKV